MSVTAEYFPPGQRPAPAAGAAPGKPCCADCAPPAEKQRLVRAGARMALAAAAARRQAMASGGLGEDAAADPYDRLIWWPGDIKNFAAQADGEISSLARDWTVARGNGQISEAQFRSWRVFYDEWAAYFAGLGALAYLTGTTVAEIKSFRARALQWRNALAQSGGRLTSPEPPAAASGPAGGTTPGWLKWTAAGAIAIGGAIAVGHVARAVSAFRRTAT